MKISRWITSGIFVVFLSATLAVSLFAADDFFVKPFRDSNQSMTVMPGEILVTFKPGVERADMAVINGRYGAEELSSSRFAETKRLKVPPHKSVDEMVAIYNHNPNVAYAEPNFVAHAFAAPNDPYYSPYQWHLDNPVYGGIHMESAWDVTSGAPNVIVAVVDTGVAYEDYQETVPLNKRRSITKTYQQAPDLANTSFVAGYDFVNADTHPNDDEGHGTHVTGTIAQSTNNGLGVAGVAPGTSIMPVKVLDSGGSGSYFNIAEGIYFATDNGAKVISMSLGGSVGSITLENALAYANSHGVTIVCASGNDGSATTISYPAAYDAYCIAVGATRYDEAVAGYSNRGASLDLTAPGGDTSVDQNGDGYVDGVLQQTFGASPTDFGYYFYQGTSMATPHVSGVAALLLAQNPSRTPAMIRAILQSTAEDKGASGWDSSYGWGIVDAAAALGYNVVQNQTPVAQINAPTTGTEDVAANFDGTGSYDDDGDPLTYQWDFGDGSTVAGATVSHAYAAGGEYQVSLVVNDGKTDSAATTAQIWIDEVNDPPVADAGPDKAALVNQEVSFDASGSYDDADGIASYAWTFGDGASATGALVSHTYGAAGSYTVNLTVTDQGGLQGTDQASVTVSEPTVNATLTSAISMALDQRTAGKNLFVSALATVSITDASGSVEGVTVNGTWSGDISAIASGVTDAAGQVTFASPEVKNPAGGTTFTFTVTEVQKPGYDSVPQGETNDYVMY